MQGCLTETDWAETRDREAVRPRGGCAAAHARQWRLLSSVRREVYDRGNGATILLYNLTDRTVLLTRQFRIPAFMNGRL